MQDVTAKTIKSLTGQAVLQSQRPELSVSIRSFTLFTA